MGTILGNSVEVDGKQQHTRDMIGGGWKVAGIAEGEELALTILPNPPTNFEAVRIVVNRRGHVLEVGHI
jgi:hypothetical protein